jgi:16S rRNA (guanine966-N2)-methyltransferase
VRIVAGTARGRPLFGPRSAKTIRPTADRVRETVFNVIGPWLEGQTVLDLFAGTGALAMESISRGAVRAVMVDREREATELCRKNAEQLGFQVQAEVMAMPVERATKTLAAAGARFDIVFADPPYAARALAATAQAAAALLAPGGVFCVEHDRREDAPERVGLLARVDQRRFGDTLVSLYRVA